MSIPTLILGEPGTGKTSALRHMNPAETLLIQTVKKPLPFRSKEWRYFDAQNNPSGNIFVADTPAKIMNLMQKTRRKVICIDDANYLMSNAFLRRAQERGYEKFIEIAQETHSIFNAAAHLDDDVRVYLFAHTHQTDDGVIRFKTIGRLLDEKISLDGLVTICFRTVIRDGQYFFSTRNNGSDTVKTPIGLFDSELVENDLQHIDQQIAEFYALH